MGNHLPQTARSQVSGGLCCESKLPLGSVPSAPTLPTALQKQETSKPCSGGPWFLLIPLQFVLMLETPPPQTHPILTLPWTGRSSEDPSKRGPRPSAVRGSGWGEGWGGAWARQRQVGGIQTNKQGSPDVVLFLSRYQNT